MTTNNNTKLDQQVLQIIIDDTKQWGNCRLSFLKNVAQLNKISERRLITSIERLMNSNQIKVKVINQQIHFTA